jgi:hypothetical protein
VRGLKSAEPFKPGDQLCHELLMRLAPIEFAPLPQQTDLSRGPLSISGLRLKLFDDRLKERPFLFQLGEQGPPFLRLAALDI